ncbi:phycobilisome protein [Leptolyngbya sp. FACHB-261]|uniref:phycobilisome protein n=1 Tax=Leptolyngbya sp. FACHB-261 TaxID=2692806 RepID=UPI001688A9E4|nr:phycobilisome protein [Leptolyngbya sp. FACHB-261]MBD2101162.1 phycobilisome protein [Leptolyngbya sp. FACHB-261]
MSVFTKEFKTTIQGADGRYLNADELVSLEAYLSSFALRMQTHQLLQEQESLIVERVMARYLRQDPKLDARFGAGAGEKCIQDMTEVLRYSAVALLRNDEEYLRENLLFWLQTIMRALEKQDTCNLAYGLLQEVITETLPADSARLANQYISIAHEMLGSPS